MTTLSHDAGSALSHDVGETDPPLLEQTIPDNLDATVARFGEREALVDVPRGHPLDVCRVRGRGRPAGPGAARRGCRQG